MTLTDTGRAELLKMVLLGVDTTQIGAGGSMYLGLCNDVPALGLTLADLTEPTIGTNGYARIEITRDTTGFPNSGTVNGVPYLETADAVWEASGGDFDSAISRLFLTPEETATIGEVWALGEALIAPVTIGPSTDAADRTFRFRQYMR